MIQKQTLLLNVKKVFSGMTAVSMLFVGSYALAATTTTNFQLTINPGTLGVAIVDASWATVGSPSVVFSAQTASFSCQTPGSSGTLGTNTQRIYVTNPDGADNGWTLSIAPSATTDVWTDTVPMDFNDPTGSPAGCSDGADTDTARGQMSMNPNAGTLAIGQCIGGCSTANVTKGSSAAFSEGVTDSITIATAAAAADDIADYKITDIPVTQTIPGSQPASAGYDINMILTATAS